jgi:hypothetical protein
MGARLLALCGAGGVFLSLASCGSPCPFGLLSRRTYAGEVACCGASGRQDLQAPADVEVDLGNVGVTGQPGRVDLFLTRADCDRLFDGAYPPAAGVAPRCPVILGPVAPGVVSARQKISTGTYRIHAYALSSNTAASLFAADVAFWGENCSGVVF